MKNLTIIFLFFSTMILSECFAQNKVIIRNNIPSGSTVSTIDSSFYNIKTYGALGDNSTNNTTFIQNAINAVHAAGGGKLYVPSGIYKTNKLTSYNDVTLFGDGYTSIIKSITADTILVMRGVGGAAYTSNVLFDGIWFQGNASVVGVYLQGLANFTMYRTYISLCTGGVGRGLMLNACLVGTINNSGFSSNNVGVYGYGNYTTLVAINNCVNNANATWAIDWSGGGQLMINNLDAEGNGQVNDSLTGTIYYHDNIWPGGVHIKGGWAEQNFGTDLYIKNNISSQASNYPVTTHHSIDSWQNIGHQYDFTKRNIAIIGNNQRMEIKGSIINGAITNIVADGSNNIVYVSPGSFFENKIERGGATVVQQ